MSSNAPESFFTLMGQLSAPAAPALPITSHRSDRATGIYSEKIYSGLAMGRKTNRGKKFKKCLKCGCQAKSNRQKNCNHCGIDTEWSKPVKKPSTGEKKRKRETVLEASNGSKKIKTTPRKYKDDHTLDELFALVPEPVDAVERAMYDEISRISVESISNSINNKDVPKLVRGDSLKPLNYESDQVKALKSTIKTLKNSLAEFEKREADMKKREAAALQKNVELEKREAAALQKEAELEKREAAALQKIVELEKREAAALQKEAEQNEYALALEDQSKGLEVQQAIFQGDQIMQADEMYVLMNEDIGNADLDTFNEPTMDNVIADMFD
tara:strand:- start:137 stop:1120 length:984 start_codon:yes stop_codon:yes gene_type:complete